MDELIIRYRNTAHLLRRQYASQEVQHAVLGLACQLKFAVAGGLDMIASNIAYILDLCEPLGDVDELHRAYLHISYLVYVQRDIATARHSTEMALTRHDDERLRRVLSVLQQASGV